MTEQFARMLLAGPLRFGDESLIQAKRLLEAIEPYRARLARCRFCEGRGVRTWRRGHVKGLCVCLRGAGLEIVRALGVDWHDAA